MIVLITGVAGFIGSNLCERLLKSKFSVIGIDNFDNFYSRKLKEQNIEIFSNYTNFKFYELDICKDLELLKNEKIDIVIHLAAKAGVLNSIHDIEPYIQNNVIGTNNVLELMRTIGCDKIIFTSSSSVYGNTSKKSFLEDDNTDFPLTPYATSKKSCEMLLFNYYHIFNINSIILRLFSVYGKNQRPDLLFNKFSDRIMNNKEVEIYGDGNSTRDYTEVSDVVNSILLSISFLINNNNVYDIFNIGNSNPISINMVIDILYKSFQKEPKVKYLASHNAEMPMTFADINKAKQILGFTPQISFEKGLEVFCNWFKENFNSHSQEHLQFAQANAQTKNCKRACLSAYADFADTKKN